MTPSIGSYIRRILSKKILVIGDVILDNYIYGDTERVSREAPVLILKYNKEYFFPGGAGNSINNIFSLGSIPIPIGVIGNDEAGRKILQYFKRKNIRTDGIIIDKKYSTITKTRVMAGGVHTSRQQLLRIDREPGVAIGRLSLDKVKKAIDKLLPLSDGILFSDYNYGVANKSIASYVIKKSKKRKISVVVDSRYRLTEFKGASTSTPNEVEMMHSLGIHTKYNSDNEKEIIKSGYILMKKLSLDSLVVTRGRLGMIVFDKKQKKVVKIPVVGTDEVTDVTGAGDTVASVVAVCLANKFGIVDASYIANYAASIVVMKRGTAFVTKEELISAVEKQI